MENKPDSTFKVNTDQISRVAYDLWEKAGRPGGRDTEFWLEAEKQLRTASAAASETTRVPVAESTSPPPAPAASRPTNAPPAPTGAIPSLPQTVGAAKPGAATAIPSTSAKVAPAEPAPAKGARLASPAPAQAKAKDDAHKANRIHSEPAKPRTRGARP